MAQAMIEGVSEETKNAIGAAQQGFGVSASQQLGITFAQNQYDQRVKPSQIRARTQQNAKGHTVNWGGRRRILRRGAAKVCKYRHGDRRR
jgi:hypothetical protein